MPHLIFTFISEDTKDPPSQKIDCYIHFQIIIYKYINMRNSKITARQYEFKIKQIFTMFFLLTFVKLEFMENS